MPPIRLFLLDEHDVVRDGLSLHVGRVQDIEVVGEARTAAAALEDIPRLQPDVAIVDAELPDGEGVQVVRTLRGCGVRTQFIVFTCLMTADLLIQARMAGAAGAFGKNTPLPQVLAAVRDVAAGRSLIDPTTLDQVRVHRSCDPLEGLLPDFTAQEQRIVRLITEGSTNREIGEQLGVTEKTARNYVSGILAKLDFRNRTEVAVYVTRATADPTRRPCGTSGRPRPDLALPAQGTT